MSIEVSVVVPTYRRDDLLRCCIGHLRRQTLAPERYEIVVADDGPSESTRALVAALAAEPGAPLRYVPVTETQGPAGARNAAWRTSAGRVVAFTDDDTLPDADWLRAGLEAMAAADAVTGRTIVPLPKQPTDYERDTAGLATAEFITANCFVRREALEEVGGFDERFQAAWREDSDLHFSLLAAGKRIVRAEEAVVVHPVRPGRWGISLWQQRKGMYDPLLYRKHRAFYRRHIAPFPWTYYLSVTGLALALAGAVAQAPAVAATGLLLWLAVTLAFAQRRLRGASRSWKHVAEMLVTSAVIPALSVYWRLRGSVRYGVLYFS